MNLQIDRKTETEAVIEITATQEELSKIKNKVLHKLAPKVKLAGFRDGKAPMEMVEKNIDQQLFQTEFIDEAVNTLYVAAIKEGNLRPVGQPKVEIKKFVPFTAFEVTLELPVVGEVKLPSYKKKPAKPTTPKIGKKEITEVLKNLQLRGAEKSEVKRAAKDGDEAVIDFKGVDAKGKPVKGADGTDYPLALGSGTFIPGFEENVIGLKPGDEKEFKVTFPKDYGAKALQNAKVTFTVTIKKVQEVTEPKLDDKFAATVGPFKSMADLEADIQKQLEHEQKHKVERDYEAKIVNDITDRTEVSIPESLITEQEEMVLQEVRQNVIQRGMTFDEFLASQGMTEEEYKKKEVTKEANRRVKAGLVLSEIADKEGIDVTPEELEARIQQLKGQYNDPQMQQQLEMPDNRRELNSRIRSEKVIQFLKG
ncbi:MAG: trigger factor [Candidatus Saccharimonadales bacterium]|jgi:trigger factor